MASKFSVKFTNNFPRISSQSHKGFTAVVKKTTFDVQAGYQGGVGVDTGTLKNSIQVEFPDDYTGLVFTNISYAPPHEYGTRYFAGNPALTQAIENNRRAFNSAIDSVLNSLR